MSRIQSKNAASKTSALWRGHTVGVCRTLTAQGVCCITTTGSSILLRQRGGATVHARGGGTAKTSGSHRTRWRGGAIVQSFKLQKFTKVCIFERKKKETNQQSELPLAKLILILRGRKKRRKKKLHWENHVNTGKQYCRRNTASTCTQQAKQRATHQQSAIEHVHRVLGKKKRSKRLKKHKAKQQLSNFPEQLQYEAGPYSSTLCRHIAGLREMWPRPSLPHLPPP